MDAYVDLKSMHYTIKVSLTDLSSTFNKQDTLTKELIEPIFDSKISKLESATDTLLQSNTVSFLFQILAFALISIGGYFLIYFQNKSKMIEENAERIALINNQVIENEKSMTVISNYIYSTVLLYRIPSGRSPMVIEILPKLRSYFSHVKSYLSQDDVYLNESVLLTCINIQSEINIKISALNTNNRFQDLIKLNNEIKGLLIDCRKINNK